MRLGGDQQPIYETLSHVLWFSLPVVDFRYAHIRQKTRNAASTTISPHRGLAVHDFRMRLAKARKSRKHLNFYRAAHGFRPPFTVLVDGTALQTALNVEVWLQDELPKLLGGRCEIVVTRAVVAELRALGKDFAAAAAQAQKLQYLASENSDSALESVLALVQNGNPQHLFVLTEDKKMQLRVASIPGVPLLRFARDRLMLEAPCRGEAEPKPVPRSAPKAGKGGEGARAAPAPEGQRAPGKPGVQQPPARKKLKGVNPLSCKKKKKREEPTAAAQKAGDEASSRKRKRRKRTAGDDGAPASV